MKPYYCKIKNKIKMAVDTKSISPRPDPQAFATLGTVGASDQKKKKKNRRSP